MSGKASRSLRAIPVRCVETGEVFASPGEAAAALGARAATISSVVYQGATYRGLHFRQDPAWTGPFAAAEGSEAARRAAPLKARKKTPVECIETGEVFLSASDAARAVGVAANGVSTVLDDPRKTAGGLHFARREGHPGPFAEPCASRASKLATKESRNLGQAVRCAETGEVFPSITAAARAAGVVPSALRNVLDNPGRTAAGLHFARRAGHAGPFADAEGSRARALASRRPRGRHRAVRCAETGETFPSIAAAARAAGVGYAELYAALDRPDSTAGGMHFESLGGEDGAQ